MLKRMWKRLTGQQTFTWVEDTPQGKLFLAMRRRCPSCHLDPPMWMEGPRGGMSVNVFCASCGQGYNITPIVEIAEVIHVDKRYVLPKLDQA